jgi:Ca2+-transporting ATPase
MLTKLHRLAHESAMILYEAWTRFNLIDGTTWAGAFTFNAFFSMFPAIVLMVTLASSFVDRQRATTELIEYVEGYIPITADMQNYIFDTVGGVVNARSQASLVAFVLLFWGSIQCFITLVTAINRARDGTDYSWWRLPIKSFTLFLVVVVGILMGIGIPLVVNLVGQWVPLLARFQASIDKASGFVFSPAIVFFCLILLYRFAPRRATSFRDVWIGALLATVLLRLAERGFGIYINNFASFNAIYGTFGGIMALLLWIYFSGCIFIFGACVSVAQAEHPIDLEPSDDPTDV